MGKDTLKLLSKRISQERKKICAEYRKYRGTERENVVFGRGGGRQGPRASYFLGQNIDI
jgi:hypothetical protein